MENVNTYDVEVGGMKSLKDEEKERWIEGKTDRLPRIGRSVRQ